MPKSSAKIFVSSAAEADTMALQPYPNSRKTYTVGSRPDIRVPFREIDLSPTVIKEQMRINPPFLFTILLAYTPTQMLILIFALFGLREIRLNFLLIFLAKLGFEQLEMKSSRFLGQYLSGEIC